MEREQINKLLQAAVDKKISYEERKKEIPSPVKLRKPDEVGLFEWLRKGSAESQNVTNKALWFEQCQGVEEFNSALQVEIDKQEIKIRDLYEQLRLFSDTQTATVATPTRRRESIERDLNKRLKDAITHEITKVHRQRLLISGEFTQMSISQIMSSEDSNIKAIVDLLEWNKQGLTTKDLSAKYVRVRERIEKLHQLSTKYLEGTDFNLNNIINEATETAELRIRKSAYDSVTNQNMYVEELTRLIYHDAFIPSLLDELAEITVSENAFKERTAHDGTTSTLQEDFTNKLFSTLDIYCLRLSLPKDSSKREVSNRLNSYLSLLSTSVKQKSAPTASEPSRSILVSHTEQDESMCDDSSVGSAKSDRTSGTVKSGKRKRCKVFNPGCLLSQTDSHLAIECRSIGSTIRTDSLDYEFLESLKFQRNDQSFTSLSDVDFSYTESPNESYRRKSTSSHASADSPNQSERQRVTDKNTKFNGGGELAAQSFLSSKENHTPHNTNSTTCPDDCISPYAGIK